MVKLTNDIDYIDVITNKILNDILTLRQRYNIVQRNNKIIENEIKTTIGIQQMGNIFKSDENENKNKLDDKIDEKNKIYTNKKWSDIVEEEELNKLEKGKETIINNNNEINNIKNEIKNIKNNLKTIVYKNNLNTDIIKKPDAILFELYTQSVVWDLDIQQYDENDLGKIILIISNNNESKKEITQTIIHDRKNDSLSLIIENNIYNYNIDYNRRKLRYQIKKNKNKYLIYSYIHFEKNKNLLNKQNYDKYLRQKQSENNNIINNDKNDNK